MKTASKTIDYYYSHQSPWTYMGHKRFLKLAGAARAAVNFKPVDYGRIFPQSGGLPVDKRPPQRQAYRLVELKRWSEHLGAKLNLQPAFFPVDSKPAALLAIAAGKSGGDVGKLSGAILEAVWARDKNIADPETLAAIAGEHGFDGKKLLQASLAPEIAQIYDRYTDEAIRAQVFGAPWYVYKDEPFWGQDRLELLEKALKK
ncbi:MAG: 2-hydroxychromene-2-carboxylate isomerase [Rhodospirillales bacterium]